VLDTTYPNEFVKFQLELLTGQSIYQTDKRFKWLDVQEAATGTTYTIDQQVKNSFSIPLQAERVRLYAQLFNRYGMRGTKVSRIEAVT
jgi:hypothetical protein